MILSTTKSCTGKCGLAKYLSEFAKGTKCRECVNEERREKNKAAGKVKHILQETLEIREKYKDDPVEMERQLNLAKAARSRKKTKASRESGESSVPAITHKICKGPLCEGPSGEGTLLSVDKFSKQKYGDGCQTNCKDCTKHINVQKIELHKDIDLENTTKTCKNPDCSCINPQPLTAFDKHAHYEFGRNNICKVCRKIQRSAQSHPRKETGTKKCSGKCGKILDVSEFHSDKYNTDGLQSCCKTCHIGRQKSAYSKYTGCIKKLLKDARGRAKKKNKKFDITYDDIDELYKLQNGKCAITQLEMQHDHMTERKEGDHHIINQTNMSIDRIDNSVGYVKSNIQLVCAVVNRIKHDMNLFELMYFVTCVGNHALRKQAMLLSILEEIPISPTFQMEERIKQKYKFTTLNAKNRDLDVTITHNQIFELYLKQNGKCALTGQVLTCNKTMCDISIDRINSNGHYTPDNVQLVTDSANKRKGDLSNTELISWSQTIRNVLPAILTQL